MIYKMLMCCCLSGREAPVSSSASSKLHPSCDTTHDCSRRGGLLNGGNSTLRSLIGVGNGDVHVGGNGAALTGVRHVVVSRETSSSHAAADPDVRVSLVACPDR